jgi:undecaprenyl pyrophosphate phosphatase UppP
MLWVLAVVNAPFATGVVGAVVAAVAVLAAISRLSRAIWQNERYWFTAWRWARLGAPLLFIAAMLKLAIYLGIGL